MSSTTTITQIGTQDISWDDGVNSTFKRKTSTGGSLTLNKLSPDVNIAEAYGGGTPSFSALATAMGHITAERSVYLKPGTWNVTSDLTIPANVCLVPATGAKFSVATGKTLTINGPIMAGYHQIFSWAGTGNILVSGSPTKRIQIAWYGGLKGTGKDNAAVLTKMAYALGMHQSIHLDGGSYYRIATPVSIAQTQTLGFSGDSQTGSKLYIDVGTGDDGLTLTKGGGYAGYWFENMAIVGPASCCRRGINVYDAAPFQMTNVSLLMGSTSYALALDNVDYYKLDNVDIGHFDAYPIFSSCARPHDGIGLLRTSYGSNVGDLLVYISGMTAGNGIYITGGENIKIRGSVENCATAIKVRGTDEISTRIWALDLDNLNIGDANVIGLDIDAVNNMTVGNCLVYGDSTIGRVRHCKINASDFSALTVKSDVISIGFDEVSIQTADAFVCDAQSAHFNTPIRVSQSSDVPYPGAMPQVQNLIQNSDFSRWTATTPEGWVDASGSYTKCGVALGDTVHHIAPYSAKVSTNGNAYIQPTYTISDGKLYDVLGKYCTFSMALRPGSINWSTSPAYQPKLFIDVTVAARVNSTAYKVNDFIKDGSGNTYKCVVAGTTDSSPPTYDTSFQHHTIDGGVTWVREDTGSGSGGSAVTSFVKDEFIQLAAGCLVAQNATAITVSALLYRESGGADITYYLAEPCLTHGGAPRHYTHSHGEFNKIMFINGVAFVADSYPPDNGSSEYNSGYYFPKGSACFNKAAASGSAPGGWTCTTAGAPGTWKAWANLP